MKVKDLLDSKNDPDPDTKDLIQLIKKHCPKNFKSLIEGKAVSLFRGDRSPNIKYVGNELMFFESRLRTEPRISLTGNSFINSYISASDDWKMVPDRSMSNSCTTSHEMAHQFGQRGYLIIPFDNVKTFASIAEDWNDLEINNKYELTDFGDMIGGLVETTTEIARYTKEEFLDDTPQEILDIFNGYIYGLKLKQVLPQAEVVHLLDALAVLRNYFFQERYPDRNMQSQITVFLSNYKKLFGTENPTEFMHKEMTPQKMHVELYNGYKNLQPHETDSPEIWFEGQFIALSTGRNNTEELAQSEMLRNLSKYI